MSIYYMHLFLYVYGHLQMFKILIYVIFCPDLIFLYQNKILYYLVQYWSFWFMMFDFQHYFSYIVVVRFSGGNRSNSIQRKSLTCRKSLTNLITLYRVRLAMNRVLTHNFSGDNHFFYLVYLEHSYVELDQKNV